MSAKSLADQQATVRLEGIRPGIRRLRLEQQPLGVFEPLLDPAFFAQVQMDPLLGTVVWPNGADLCPDVLYTYPERVETAESPIGPRAVTEPA